MAETKQRIERFKKPLSLDALAILVVKSKLLTGFDAKVEQAMYLDRAISGAELLQAIARTNRTAGEGDAERLPLKTVTLGTWIWNASAWCDRESAQTQAAFFGGS